MGYLDNTPYLTPDEDCWGIVGTDWDCDDGINGPYDGQVAKCPDCHGTGKLT